jgi:hypothetical protein
MTKQLSSILTFPYKYFVPIIPFGIAIILTYIIDHRVFSQGSLPMILIFFSISVVLYFQYSNLRRVEYDETKLTISTLLKTKEFELRNVVCIKKTRFDLYTILIRTENGNLTIKFLPSFNEKMINLFGERKSITEFRHKLENEETVAKGLDCK